MTAEARALVLDWYRSEIRSVLNHNNRALAFGAVRDDLARDIARDVADGRTPYPRYVAAFAVVEAVCQRKNERTRARWAAEHSTRTEQR